MDTLKPKERVLRFLRKEKIDTMPVFSGMGMLTIQAIQKMGIKFPQVHVSADAMAGSAEMSSRIFGFDAVIVPFDICVVGEAMGLKVSLYEDVDQTLYPTIPDKWPTPDAVVIPDNILEQGRMPLVDEAILKLKSIAKDDFAVGTWVLGPLLQAGQVVELDVLLKMIAKDPPRVEALLDRMTDLIIQLGRHYQDLGVDFITLRPEGSGSDIISPRVFKNLIQPRLTKILGAWKSPKVMHICGSTDMIIEMMKECGADAISVDQKNTLAQSRKKLGEDTILLGNIDPFKTLCQVSPEETEGAVRKCIDAGADAVWPGCDMWPEVKNENVEAWVRTCRTYGASPTAAVGRL